MGYPSPILSHFASADVWSLGTRSHVSPDSNGWIGRLREHAWADDPRSEVVVHVGPLVPRSVSCRALPALTFSVPRNYLWVGNNESRAAYQELGKEAASIQGRASARDTVRSRLRGTLRAAQATSPRVIRALTQYTPAAAFADETFSSSMQTIATFIASGFATRVYSVSVGNFDQHGPQRHAHDLLLGQLDRGITSLLADVAQSSPDTRVIVAAYSEFGRRVAQNRSRGTDHGAAGSMFLLGHDVVGGRHGRPPSLTDLDENGNMRHSTDFRSVYAAVLADWFDVDPAAVLDGEWSRIRLIRSV